MKRRPLPLYDKSPIDALQLHDFVPDRSFADVCLGETEFLQFGIIGCRADLLAQLKVTTANRFRAEHVGTSSGCHLFQIRGRVGRYHRAARFWLFHIRGPVWMLCTIGTRSLWRELIQPFINALYPKAAAPFLSQQELHSTLTALDTAAGGIRIRELAKRERLTRSRRKYKASREWTDEPLDDVFILAQEHDVWFRTVGVDLDADQGHQPVRFVLSKYGHVAGNGRFDLLLKFAMEQIASIAERKFEMFNGRDRASTPDRRPRPLQITYQTDVLASVVHARKLADVIRKLPRSTCTVLHGNPYLHLSVSDNDDYSAIDIWVMNTNSIIIVPQIRTSDLALKRLVNHIFERFKEGEISAYPRP